MYISRRGSIKRSCAHIGLAMALAAILGTGGLYGQKGSGGGGSKSSSAGGGGNSGGSGGGQGGASGGQTGGSSNAAPSGRIEASMLAYQASDRIAKHIATQVQGHKLYIYDSQTFASLQAYEAYDATVSAFEMLYESFISKEARSNWVTAAGGAQTIASTLAALRSTAEYAAEAVDLQLDPVIAQLASYLKGKVVVPKFLLTSPLPDELKSACPATVSHCVPPTDDMGSVGADALQANITVKAERPCADIHWTIPDQMGCLLMLRNKASASALEKKPNTSAYINPDAVTAFQQFDKLFQVFFGQLMGTSVNLSSKSDSQTAGGGGTDGGGGGGAQKGGGSGQQDDGSGDHASSNPAGNQSASVPLLSQIIQGHRLKAQLSDDSRVLVVEATEAGAGSRIKHNFFVELFWTTPTPTFTGGSIITYFLINPKTSLVEDSEVLRFTFDYGKFHGDKYEDQCNFKDGCEGHFRVK